MNGDKIIRAYALLLNRVHSKFPEIFLDMVECAVENYTFSHWPQIELWVFEYVSLANTGDKIFATKENLLSDWADRALILELALQRPGQTEAMDMVKKQARKRMKKAIKNLISYHILQKDDEGNLFVCTDTRKYTEQQKHE